MSNDRKELKAQKRRSERLLNQMLPPAVAEQLRAGRAVDAEYFDSVTIMFSDIENFRQIAGALAPLAVVELLNDIYTMFDSVIDGFDV